MVKKREAHIVGPCANLERTCLHLKEDDGAPFEGRRSQVQHGAIQHGRMLDQHMYVVTVRPLACADSSQHRPDS